MTVLAVMTVIVAPVCVLAAYLTVCGVFLLELRRRERGDPSLRKHEERARREQGDLTRPATAAATAPPPHRHRLSLRHRHRQPASGPRSWRARKSSARSATSRHPESTAREWPRSGSTEYSVAPVLRR